MAIIGAIIAADAPARAQLVSLSNPELSYVQEEMEDDKRLLSQKIAGYRQQEEELQTIIDQEEAKLNVLKKELNTMRDRHLKEMQAMTFPSEQISN